MYTYSHFEDSVYVRILHSVCRETKAPRELAETRVIQARRATRDTKETLDSMVFLV